MRPSGVVCHDFVLKQQPCTMAIGRCFLPFCACGFMNCTYIWLIMCSEGLVALLPEQMLLFVTPGVSGCGGQSARVPGTKKLPYPLRCRFPLDWTACKSCAAAI